MISENEFKEWLAMPATKEFRKVLAGKRAGLRNEWETADPSAYTQEQFVLANVANIGWCRGLAFAETFSYEDYITEIGAEDGEPKRPQAGGSSSAD